MKALIFVGMGKTAAQWLGMAPSVIGGCVATSDAGRDAANVAGYDCIGLVPERWLSSADYQPLSAEQITAVSIFLSVRVSGWSGAAAINADRRATAELLGLREVTA